MPATDTPESLEQYLRAAKVFSDFFARELDNAKKQKDYWDSVVVQTEEKLYNLRHGDVPCRPTDSED